MIPRRFRLSPRTMAVLRALNYFRPDVTKILLLLAVIGLSTFAGLMQVWPLALLVDQVLNPQPSSSSLLRFLPEVIRGTVVPQIIFLAFSVFALRILQELLTLVQSMVSLSIGHGGLLRVRCDLFRKLQELQLNYHKTNPQGDSIYRLIHDASGCQSVLDVTISVVVAAVTLTVMLGILLSRSVALTWVALVVAPLLLITNVVFANALRRNSGRAKKMESEFTSTVQRSLAAITLVQAFSRQADEYGRFRSSVSKSIRAWFRLHWQFACYRLCVGIIFGGGAAVIFGYGGYLVHQGQQLGQPDAMTVGDLVIFLTYLGMFFDPLCKLSGAAGSLQQGLAGVERVFEVLDHECSVSDRANAVSLSRRPRRLTLESVGFRYASGKEVLRDVNVTVEPGELVAFVGNSGVGKSTLLNLLPRFFDPTFGSVQLDNIDLRDIRLRDLRDHVAVVLQDCLVLPTSIAENIAYGRPGATAAEIRLAAEMAGASDFVEALPEGYNTVLLEGGQNLSGGQRQRIAIARALLTQAPIIVLDEPTSALDPQNEQLIVDTLRSLKGQRTIIVVSHRLSTVVDCDQIYVMHEGRITAHGDHSTLLTLGGWYLEMARRQRIVDATVASSPVAA